MVQHLLELMDETARAWPAVGNALMGLAVGRLMSVFDRGAFALWRGDWGGRIGKQMGKKVIWNTCMVRNHASGVEGVSLQRVLTTFCKLAGGAGTCWMLKAGHRQGFQLCSENKPPLQHLQFITSPHCCPAGTRSSKVEPAHHLCASQMNFYRLTGRNLQISAPPTRTDSRLNSTMVQAHPWIQFPRAWFKSSEIT